MNFIQEKIGPALLHLTLSAFSLLGKKKMERALLRPRLSSRHKKTTASCYPSATAKASFLVFFLVLASYLFSFEVEGCYRRREMKNKNFANMFFLKKYSRLPTVDNQPTNEAVREHKNIFYIIVTWITMKPFSP